MKGKKDTGAISEGGDALILDILLANGSDALRSFVENDRTISADTATMELRLHDISDRSTVGDIAMHRRCIECDFDALERERGASDGDGDTDILCPIGDRVEPSLRIIGSSNGGEDDTETKLPITSALLRRF